jgi:hypothetical protein
MPTTIAGFGTLTDARILSFEEKYSIRFPEDYRHFLKSFNGGMPIPKTFHVASLKTDSLMDVFLEST